MPPHTTTACCIVGGGSAGVMLSLLLARAGVPVTLLEAHRDFDRDFRGDTIHPSTLEVLHQMGLAERLHELPHVKAPAFRIMLPVGRVGINCAIADAVDAANVLGEPLRAGRVHDSHLAEVQGRRETITLLSGSRTRKAAPGATRARSTGTLAGTPWAPRVSRACASWR